MERVTSKHSLLAIVGIVVAMLVALRAEGRIAWGEHGVGFWSAAWTQTTSQHLLDPYSLSHVLHGVLLYWLLHLIAPRVPLRWQFVLAVAAEVAWEVLENSPIIIERYRAGTAAFDYVGDSILNSIGDTISMASGFLFAAMFPWTASVALFVAFELLGLYLARDNLTLNVVMLLYPIEAIKQWQLESLPADRQALAI